MVPTVLQNLAAYKHAAELKVVFTDIDGTLTSNGLLPAECYQAIWDLTKKNIQVVPVTGRPAGWCEMMARIWPIAGIIGENGGFYFAFQNKIMRRAFETTAEDQTRNRSKLFLIYEEVKKQFPRAQLASDQFSRLCDLAVDFCEDVHPALTLSDAQRIATIFSTHGATAKVSSIHVNAWFGEYDKLKMCQRFSQEIMGFELGSVQDQIIFVGDSPNDEPMFRFFNHSFAVANIKDFIPQLTHHPKYLATKREGSGFIEIVAKILTGRE